MTITFRDELGYKAVIVSEYGFSFDQSKGAAIFTGDDGIDYCIPFENIDLITAEV